MCGSFYFSGAFWLYLMILMVLVRSGGNVVQSDHHCLLSMLFDSRIIRISCFLFVYFFVLFPFSDCDSHFRYCAKSAHSLKTMRRPEGKNPQLRPSHSTCLDSDCAAYLAAAIWPNLHCDNISTWLNSN